MTAGEGQTEEDARIPAEVVLGAKGGRGGERAQIREEARAEGDEASATVERETLDTIQYYAEDLTVDGATNAMA